MARKYLVWIDILGFDEMAEDMVKYVHQRDSSKIRADLINVILEKINSLEINGAIRGKAHETDKWVLVLDSLDLMFKATSEILDHNTGYEKYEKIPLEIAWGVEEYGEWGKFDGSALMFQKPTIEFLKTRITDHYRRSYRETHEGASPRSTFIVLTEDLYSELEPLDKKICTKIECKPEESPRETKVAFFLADLNAVQQRGILYKFLEKIGRSSSRLYDRIDSIYVPPIEYEDIKRSLKANRLVFITGTPEYGKTYTALRLLWEYFNEGYEPIWMEGGEEWERRNVRRSLEEIESELNPRQIIYFEDPFGKTKYERRESLEREIGTIIDTIHNVEDVYVIITSREEIFKEFEKEHLSSTEIQKFEKRLNVKRPSYDYKRRQEILFLWGESKDCEWFKIARLRKTLLRIIRQRMKLPTPLSIRNFVLSTISIAKEAELIEKIEEKSKETAKSFADEIENMRDDKILFLSFIFLYHRIKIELVRTLYEEMVEELNIENPSEFDEALSWFKDDKLDVGRKTIAFSHPSYSEALDYLLIKGESPTRINREIFSKVLRKLAETRKTQKRVPKLVTSNFDNLTQDSRNLLFELAEREETASGSLHAIMQVYDEIPGDVENLLLKLAERNETAKAVGWVLAHNFYKLPQTTRNKLLSTLLKMEDAAKPVAHTIAEHSDKLSSDYKNHLFHLVEDDEVAIHVAWVLVTKYDRLSSEFRDLIFKFAKREKTMRAVVRAIAFHFEKVDEKGRNLLDELQPCLQQIIADLSDSARYKDKRNALSIILRAKSKLPEGFRSSILSKMLMDKEDKIRQGARKLADKISQEEAPT